MRVSTNGYLKMVVGVRPRQANLWSNAPPEDYHEFLNRNTILAAGVNARRTRQDSISRQ